MTSVSVKGKWTPYPENLSIQVIVDKNGICAPKIQNDYSYQIIIKNVSSSKSHKKTPS